MRVKRGTRSRCIGFEWIEDTREVFAQTEKLRSPKTARDTLNERPAMPADPETTIPASAEVLSLGPTDRDAVFVLAVDPEVPQMAPLLAPKRLNGQAGRTLAGLLGLSPEADGELELVNPEDLEGVGLAGYLVEGLGLDAAAVAGDRQRLEALTAPAVLVRGRIAGLEERVLPLPRGLSLVGRYGTTYTPIGLAPLSARAASGVLPPIPGALPTGWRLPRAWQVALFIFGMALLGALFWLALAQL
ncbi:hypothetical protein SAMN06297129_1835 [Pseudooceanicola antarcticus]|uniref:Uncharacterized protein n=1 Tax=Pseudooceanicola antarcticus TaxID=1247613 RepID=A0A285IR47_9RHOB|nr:hypothetical protein CVM39_01505 [Pseudooceanicola antarcticus]SNY50434.1 hypothetical protein SAMN06297129_1835 [Pseudooceanicola antarcticus]